MLERLLILILFIGSSCSVGAQRLVFENIGTKNGLPASEVYKLFQDKKGYVWVFTEYGIVKYNGSNFVPVCTNLPLEECAAYGLAESPSGNLYFINSEAHAYRIHKDRAYKIKGIERAANEMTKASVFPFDLFFDDKGTLCFSSRVQTYRFPYASYTSDKLPKEKWKSYNNMKLYVERKPNPNLNYKNGGVQVEFIAGKLIQTDSRAKFSWINPILYETSCPSHVSVQYSGDHIYIASVHSVIHGTGQRSYNVLAVKEEILTMNKAPNGHIWLGTVNGLYEYDRNMKLIERHLNNTIVSNILFDNQGGLWISTIGRGIYHCRDIERRSYNNLFGSGINVSTLKVLNGQLFIGTSNGRLFTNRHHSFYEIDCGTERVLINDVEFCNGKFVIAKNSGLFFCKQNLTDYRSVSETNKLTVFALQKVSATKLLVITGRCIGTFDCAKRILHLDLVLGRCREVLERNKGEYFMLTNKGVCRYRNGKYDFPHELRQLKDINLSRLRLDQQQNLWFCAREKGLYQLDKNNQIRHFDRLPSLVTKDILFLSDGTVVLATNKGAFYTSIEAMNVKSSWKRLLDEEMSCLQEFDGSVLLGTKNGLVSIRKDHIRTARKRQFYLESVRVGKRRMNIEAGLNLNHDQNDLFFNYDILDFERSERILTYELRGPTVQNGRVLGTEVHLQSLLPGDYTLEVVPKAYDSENSDQRLVTHFRIHPAFWQTGFFLISVIILSVGLIFLISVLLIKRNHKKKLAKEEIEKLLTEYRITALKAQVNPHFMSNSLVAIQHLILESETDKANLYIAKFSLLLRSLLDYSSKSSATLRDELNMIELYVELEQLRFSHQFTFNLYVDPELEVGEICIPALITQPFVENAIWHGLLPLKNQREPQLTLKVLKGSDGISISIIDNGVGRSRNTNPKERESKGTKLIIQRLESLNQLYQTNGGKIEFTDVKDELGNPVGTTVVIALPDRMLRELKGG